MAPQITGARPGWFWTSQVIGENLKESQIHRTLFNSESWKTFQPISNRYIKHDKTLNLQHGEKNSIIWKELKHPQTRCQKILERSQTISFVSHTLCIQKLSWSKPPAWGSTLFLLRHTPFLDAYWDVLLVREEGLMGAKRRKRERHIPTFCSTVSFSLVGSLPCSRMHDCYFMTRLRYFSCKEPQAPIKY